MLWRQSRTGEFTCGLPIFDSERQGFKLRLPSSAYFHEVFSIWSRA
jgi:hypothetical protein